MLKGDLIFPHFVGDKDERVTEKLDRCLCQIIDIVLVSQIVYIDYRSGTAFCCEVGWSFSVSVPN